MDTTWLSAETAPRTGEHFLAARFDGGIGFGICGGKEQAIQTVVHFFNGRFSTSVNEQAQINAFEFTHWMPLPELPGDEA